MGNFNVASLLGRLSKKQENLSIPWSQPEKKILFVCTGNIARSASAQYLAGTMAGEDSTWTFDSAGVGALVGAPVAPDIDTELQKRGVDFSTHKAKQITEKLVAESALVLVMEGEHRNWLLREWPQYHNRVHLLKEVARLQPVAGNHSDLISYMQNHDKSPKKEDNIADPYRQGPEAARIAIAEIEEALKILIPWLGN